MESLSDINLDGIGWVAAGGMSGDLWRQYRMRLEWAAELHDLCKAQGIPFLFKQVSARHSEQGINALSLLLAQEVGEPVDAEKVPLIRQYPATSLPLLPFTEHGKRFTTALYEAYQGMNYGIEGGGIRQEIASDSLFSILP